MSKYVIDDTTLIAIGDAVREKDGTTEGIKVSELASRILAIPAGGGGEDLPEEAFNITGQCNYKFSGGGWNWFLDAYGNRITTNNITNISYMFAENKTIESIPFDINVASSCKDMNYMFNNCYELKSAPLVKGTLSAPTGNYSGVLNMSYLFQNCRNLKEIPYDYFYNFGGEAFWAASENYYGDRSGIFNNCYKLRKAPDIRMLKTSNISSYAGIYYSTFYYCYSLDEITNYPVVTAVAISSNGFNNNLAYCFRLKKFTFETNEDGSPIVAQWKNQTISTVECGYAVYSSYITNDTDLTTSTQVINDTTYVALKDNEDYWTADINYSRYNHDSAVATINSLPDTSAYGTNIIKFRGAAGAKTDGGAINTLTEAEIAVAAAKGWTVTLV